MHGVVDTSSIKSSPGSPEPVDNTNFSVILEAPQVFGYVFGSAAVYTDRKLCFKIKNTVCFSDKTGSIEFPLKKASKNKLCQMHCERLPMQFPDCLIKFIMSLKYLGLPWI